MKDDFKVSYDKQQDILYLACAGEEEESVELAPGITLEYDADRALIGIEIFQASERFKDVLKLMESKLSAA